MSFVTQVRMDAGAQKTLQKRGWLSLLLLAVLSVGAIIAMSLAFRADTFIGVLKGVLEWSAANPWQAAGLYFVWCFLCLCLVVPAGSLTMLAGGYVLGYLAAPVFFVAMLAASFLVHLASGFPILERLHARAANKGGNAPVRRYIANFLQRTQARPILLTAVLRLVPIFPSAVIAFLARQMGVNSRDQILGTLATGWIRPLAYAAVGASLPGVESFTSLDELLRHTNLPVLIFSTVGLLALVLVWLLLELKAARWGQSAQSKT